VSICDSVNPNVQVTIILDHVSFDITGKQVNYSFVEEADENEQVKLVV